MTVFFMIDYFRVTVHAPLVQCEKLFHDCFAVSLGGLSDLPHGAKGFKGIKGGLLGFQLKHTPGGDRQYCTFEFPGKACGSIAPEQFKDFYTLLNLRQIRFNVTRLDLAFDNVPFTPEEFYQAILDDMNRAEGEKPVVRSLTQRESVTWMSEPLKRREDESDFGRDTCYFGSRSSERFIRVYNMRGPTRLEFEVKGDRAPLVTDNLMKSDIEYWPKKAISHLGDFIEIYRPWWQEFIGDQDRAYKKLKYAKVVELEKTKQWLLEQVAPGLSAVVECTNGEFLLELDQEGRKRMNKRYGPLLYAHGKSQSRKVRS